MELFFIKFGFISLYLLLFGFLVLTLLGLAGNWFIAGAAVVIKLLGWGTLSWPWVLAIVALAVVAEIIEALLGMVIVARQGGTRYGVIGSFVGGLAGVIIGGSVVPPIGSLIFGFVGAFAGAAIGEYIRDQRLDQAMRVGFWSFVGRSAATMAKVAAGVLMVWIIIVMTW